MQRKTIYALGFFDGVHLGHQALLHTCRELAQRNGCRVGAVTFTTHPDGIVKGQATALVNTLEDRRHWLHHYGAENVIELPFDEKLMRTHWAAFLEDLLVNGAAGFVCGSDFRFGAGGCGTAQKLEAFCQERNLPCAIVPQQEKCGIRVSSTHIRKLLESGEVEEAAAFLGHRHCLTQTVQHGYRVGRTIGVPTVNLIVPPNILTPALGVYITRVYLPDGRDFAGVTNVGTRPTVSDSDAVSVETFLLDFDGDLYDQTIRVEFCRRIRGEKKFGSLEELRDEIRRNADQTREYFREN
jgi:riboflavin kinase/FMN adenylyltransferase